VDRWVKNLLGAWPWPPGNRRAAARPTTASTRGYGVVAAGLPTCGGASGGCGRTVASVGRDDVAWGGGAGRRAVAADGGARWGRRSGAGGAGARGTRWAERGGMSHRLRCRRVRRLRRGVLEQAGEPQEHRRSRPASRRSSGGADRRAPEQMRCGLRPVMLLCEKETQLKGRGGKKILTRGPHKKLENCATVRLHER